MTEIPNLKDSLGYKSAENKKKGGIAVDKPIGNTEKDLGSMNYSEFCLYLNGPDGDGLRLAATQDNSIGDDLPEEYQIYEEIKTGRFFFLEGGENDASDFYELKVISTLGYINEKPLGMSFKEANKTFMKFFKAKVCTIRTDGAYTYATWFIK